ncbi:unnamed protein product [Hermetia illucens]|uniref:Uncharacterized protein n=2 Tax=Hermetia illucens TaxID=343691 RepID=A0A7R8YRN7_HERIL|nr:unnamed protein product [Hermetia illucens]
MQSSRLGRLPEHFGKRDGLQENYGDLNFGYHGLLFEVGNELGSGNALGHMQYTFEDNYGGYKSRKIKSRGGNLIPLNDAEEDRYDDISRQPMNQFSQRFPEQPCYGGMGESRCAIKKMRRRRCMGGGRLKCEPYMLPYNTTYYPCGFYGPCIQLCPYVPLMAF